MNSERGSERLKVLKRDGVWQVRDGSGRIRYAANDYHMTFTFALMAALKKSAAVLSWSFKDIQSWISDPKNPDPELGNFIREEIERLKRMQEDDQDEQ